MFVCFVLFVVVVVVVVVLVVLDWRVVLFLIITYTCINYIFLRTVAGDASGKVDGITTKFNTARGRGRKATSKVAGAHR